MEEEKKVNAKSKKVEKKKSTVVLKNTKGEDVKWQDYFFESKSKQQYLDWLSAKKLKDTTENEELYRDSVFPPKYFNKVCGFPVDREDLTEMFNKIFKPESGVLFYKTQDKEVYVIIVPLKYSEVIGDFNDSIDGDFHRHAISFVTEGSVNLNSMESKIKKVATHIKIVA